MKKISICLMVLLLSGCLNQSIESTLIKGNENDSTLEILETVDDIENWDIDINDVESVELYVFFEIFSFIVFVLGLKVQEADKLLFAIFVILHNLKPHLQVL